jgi:hypothetical protein
VTLIMIFIAFALVVLMFYDGSSPDLSYPIIPPTWGIGEDGTTVRELPYNPIGDSPPPGTSKPFGTTDRTGAPSDNVQWMWDPGTSQWVNTTQNIQSNSSVSDSSSQPGQADVLTAQLLRDQFADWQRLFQPIELGQMQQLSTENPAVLENAIAKAGGAAEGASTAMGGIYDRTNRALGITPTGGQDQAARRLMDLNKAQNIAGAEDAARENVRMQDQLILLGSSPSPIIAGN